jgi:inhibitor of cysteine peptidase
MGFMLRGAIVLAVLLGSHATAQDALRLKLGASASVRLPETPSTGYSWRIDEGASKGLDLIGIADRGHTPGKPLPGAPGVHVWSIRAQKLGQASIRFVYQRPWEPAPAETREIRIEIFR